MKVGENLSSALVDEARQALQGDRAIDRDELQRLKAVALDDGVISHRERTFMANLDREPLITQLGRFSSEEALQNAQLAIDGDDYALAMDDQVVINGLGGGAQVFEGGSLKVESLYDFHQFHNESGDHAACSCNASVAALALRGPEAMAEALDKVQGAIPQGNPGDLAAVTRIASSLEQGTLTTADLNELASVLYRTYDSDSSDAIMSYGDVIAMGQDLGLADGQTAQNAFVEGGPTLDGDITGIDSGSGQLVHDVDAHSPEFRAAQRATAQAVLATIDNGDSALVNVFNGPPGETNTPNHYLEVGRDPDGVVYVYDRMGGDSNFITGQAAEDYLADRIGIGSTSSDNPPCPAQPIAPVIPRHVVTDGVW
ncbi:MAG: hypothetical protein ACFCBW_22185 [Candidatus Competibacterales bacterium]